MDTCVLVPEEFSLVLTLHPNPKNVLEMNVALWSNKTLTSGTVFYPDQGSVRLDKLEIYSSLCSTDVRLRFGCQETVSVVDDREVRHCNWVRFLRSSNKLQEVNLVGVKVKGQPVFQTIKTILPNEEIVAYLDDDDNATLPESEEMTADVERTDNAEDRMEESTTHEEVRVKVEEPELEEPLDLMTSPVSRDDDCRSSVSDVTNSDATHSGDDELEKLTTSSNEFSSQPSSPSHTAAETPSPPSPTRPVMRRSRERTWLPCEVCGKKFDRPSLLKRHMRTHTGEKPHACDVCGKAFSTSSSLNTHRRIHSGEKPHECPVCGKRFTASSNLYYHRMTHNKVKPHKCKLCEKSFPTPGDLRSHMYVHNGSWPFRCDVCNRGFSKQTNLKNHLLLHTGDKPHECRICGKKFALQCNLKTHAKVHEGENQRECIHCSRLFTADPSSLSSRCDHCRLSVLSPSTVTQKKKPLSDFSISKLTDMDSKQDENSPPRHDVSSPSVIGGLYNPLQYISPPLGHTQCFSPESPLTAYPRGFPGLGHYSSPEFHKATGDRDSLQLPPPPGILFHPTSHPIRSPLFHVPLTWPGLMAK